MPLKKTLSSSEHNALETVYDITGNYYATEERILNEGVSESDFDSLVITGYIVGANLGGADSYFVSNEGRAYLMLTDSDDVPEALADQFAKYMGITDVYAESMWHDGTPVIYLEFDEGALEEAGMTAIQLESQKIYPFYFNAVGRSDYDPALHNVEIDGSGFYLYFNGQKR